MNRNAVDLNKFNTLCSNSAFKNSEVNEKHLIEFKELFGKKRSSALQLEDHLNNIKDFQDSEEEKFLASPHQIFSFSKEKVHPNRTDSMKAVDQVVKYLNKRKNMPNHHGYVKSGKLITSDGVAITRGRVHSNTNASTSSQSRSKPRKNFPNFSSSLERRGFGSKERLSSENNRPMTSTILVQNF